MRISIDYDGVLCHTPFGRLAVHAPGGVPDLPDDYARCYDEPVRPNPLRVGVEYARFAWRRMEPEAAPLLRDMLAAGHEVWIVTGRSVDGERLIAGWLRRSGLAGSVGLRMAPPGLRPAQHKLATAKLLAIGVHLDDDPRTAHYLAEHGVPRVYLLDREHIDAVAPMPRGLAIVRSLAEFKAALKPEN
jgi:hypothetical protein